VSPILVREDDVRNMNRSEIIRRLVLREISDDYENVDQIIFPNVFEGCAKRGVKIERSNVVEALAELIEDGLAKAYVLSGTKPYSTQLPGMPGLEIVEEHFKTYFYITKKGVDLVRSYVGLPFDDLD
jgi:hypothetical protein